MNKQRNIIYAIIVLVLLANIISSTYHKRMDLTKTKQYTLSTNTTTLLANVKSPIVIDIFLKGDNFPSEYRRLQTETLELLEEYKSKNSFINFQFINPLDNNPAQQNELLLLQQSGLSPLQLNTEATGKASQTLVFPWAIARFNNKTVTIPLIKNKIGATQQELISNSIQNLEYAFTDGIKKLTTQKHHKIAILKGNNELSDIYIADILKTLKTYYYIAPFTLDSVASNPQETLKKLETFDLAIIAKPTTAFNESEKFVLDQYAMQGGKCLWLIDEVAIDKDSLYNDSGKNFAVARHLNLTDMFFSYGVRINPVLVSSPFSAPITLAMGEGNDVQYQPIQWPYSPLANPESKHPIVNQLNLIKFDFANPIDTLKNAIKKTVLLESSNLSNLEGVPTEISLDIVTQTPDPQVFNKGKQILAVLLEGNFNSAFNNRLHPFKIHNFKAQSESNKMVFIADGDVIKNDVINGKPQELGFDKWTAKAFGNKEFILNTINYLLDDTGIINIRTKKTQINFLNTQKIADEKGKWQFINIALPLILLGLFGFVFITLRRRKYKQ